MFDPPPPLQLAVSPQQKASGDPLFLAHQSQLALRVEGVVQHGARGPNRAPFRSVHKVLVTVTTAPGLPNAAGTSAQRGAPQDSKVRPSSASFVARSCDVVLRTCPKVIAGNIAVCSRPVRLLLPRKWSLNFCPTMC